MPAPRLPDEVIQETVEVYLRTASQVATAAELNLARATVQSRLREAAARGFLNREPVMPGFRISKTTAVYDKDENLVREFVQQKPDGGEKFEVPPGHVVKGVSTFTDASGNIIAQWTKTREGERDPLVVVDALKAAFADYVPAAEAAPVPEQTQGDLLTLFPCGDWHIGMFAWGREVGQNWDLKIAEDVIGRGIDDTIGRSPPSGLAIILSGGDLVHSDNKTNQTSRSGALLDVDGRYQKVVEAATRLMVRTVDAALRRHARVTVRVLPGNHDEHTAVAVAYFLLAWYRNEPRVTVDVDPSLFFWHRFGSVLIGATHGHTVKIQAMPSIMAHRRAEDWGVTKFRYIHGFHLHHAAKFATEGGGVIAEIHQAPIPQDAWHYGSGFLSGRSLQAITYHRDYGEVGRTRVAILDAAE